MVCMLRVGQLASVEASSEILARVPNPCAVHTTQQGYCSWAFEGCTGVENCQVGEYRRREGLRKRGLRAGAWRSGMARRLLWDGLRVH